MSDTPWTDDHENVATVYDREGQPYEMQPFVLSTDARTLEREVTALRKIRDYRVEDKRAFDALAIDRNKWQDRAEKAEAENAALREDKERLDWLETRQSVTWNDVPPAYFVSPIFFPSPTTVREAIDKARAALAGEEKL